MVVFNYSGAEINAKVVYYGPALSGKTTNLESIYEQMPSSAKGKMVSMKTRTDRTLFFDFLPLELGEINGYKTRILLYTVPGQVYYNATRKLVLKGADAVVFVADSSPDKMQENVDSLRNLEENLNEHGLTLDTIPWVMQYNKRDLPDALPIKELNDALNVLNVPAYEAVASTGEGIYESFQGIAALLYNQLVERLEKSDAAAPGTETEVPVEPATATDAPVEQAPMPSANVEPPGVPEAVDVPPVPSAVVEPPEVPSAIDVPPIPSVVVEPPEVPKAVDVPPMPSVVVEPAEVPKAVDVPPKVEAKPATVKPPATEADERIDPSVSSVVDEALRELDLDADESVAEDTPDPVVDAATPAANADDASLQFESMNELTPVAHGNSVDRVIDFEDTADAASPAEPEDQPTFITNPFSSGAEPASESTDSPTQGIDTPSTEPVPVTPTAEQQPESKLDPKAQPAVEPKPESQVEKKPESQVEKKSEPIATATKTTPVRKPATPATPATPTANDDVRVIKVPVVLTRAQMRKSIPLRLELEIQVTDADG